MRLVLAALVVGCFAGLAEASLTVTSVSRGYTSTSGFSDINTDTMGRFETTGSFANNLGGTSYFFLDSDINPLRFSAAADGYISSVSEDELNESRSTIFMTVNFTLTSPYHYTLFGVFGGDSEDDRYGWSTSLVGGSTTHFNYKDPQIITSWNGFLEPGDYTFNVEVWSLVASGLDAGRADVWANPTSLSFFVPEASSVITWSLLGIAVGGAYWRKRFTFKALGSIR